MTRRREIRRWMLVGQRSPTCPCGRRPVRLGQFAHYEPVRALGRTSFPAHFRVPLLRSRRKAPELHERSGGSSRFPYRRFPICLHACLVTVLVATIGCAEQRENGGLSREPWATWRVAYGIGSANNGPPGTVFGSIRDATTTSRLSVVVLDGINKTVYLVDSTGAVQAAVGKEGDGPGEFRDPVSIVALRGDTLVVVDRGRMSIMTFVWDSPALQFHSSSRLPFWPNDACALHGRLFVLGLLDRHVLHEVTTDGRIIRSIASLPGGGADNSSSAAMRALLEGERGGGWVTCSEDANAIVHVTERLGEAEAVDPAGTRLWSVTIRDFVQPRRTLRGAGARYDFDTDAGRAQRVTSATSLGDGLVQIVVEEAYPRARKKQPMRFGIVLRTVDGVEVGRFQHAPEFLDARAEVAVSRVEGLVPRIDYWVTRGDWSIRGSGYR
jgi:hypothetical protein